VAGTDPKRKSALIDVLLDSRHSRLARLARGIDNAVVATGSSNFWEFKHISAARVETWWNKEYAGARKCFSHH
jgi:hypothetical protein